MTVLFRLLFYFLKEHTTFFVHHFHLHRVVQPFKELLIIMLIKLFKALNQKLEATNRDHFQVALKNGNLVLTFSTAAFEAFRAVLQTLSNSQPFQDINFEFETRRRVVRNCIE